MLYELLGSAQAAMRGGRTSSSAADAGSSMPPRQSIRVPVGWFWIAAVVMLALVAIAYQFGRAAGDRAGFARGQEWRSDGEVQSRLAGVTPDPVGRGAVGGTGGAGASRDAGGVPRNMGSATAQPKNEAAPRGTSAPTLSASPRAADATPGADPRVKGLNYWIIARPGVDEAPAMADFIRSQGLEVAVVPDHNPRFLRIIAVPGFQGGAELGRRQESKIRSIGKQWKNAARGHRDFDDAYPELHR